VLSQMVAGEPRLPRAIERGRSAGSRNDYFDRDCQGATTSAMQPPRPLPTTWAAFSQVSRSTPRGPGGPRPTAQVGPFAPSRLGWPRSVCSSWSWPVERRSAGVLVVAGAARRGIANGLWLMRGKLESPPPSLRRPLERGHGGLAKGKTSLGCWRSWSRSARRKAKRIFAGSSGTTCSGFCQGNSRAVLRGGGQPVRARVCDCRRREPFGPPRGESGAIPPHLWDPHTLAPRAVLQAAGRGRSMDWPSQRDAERPGRRMRPTAPDRDLGPDDWGDTDQTDGPQWRCVRACILAERPVLWSSSGL